MKNIKLPLIIGVIIVFLGGVWFFTNSKSSNSVTNITNKIVDNLTSEKGVKCTQIMAEGDAGSSESTMYIYKNKFRYDSVIKHEELGTRNMHVINDGEKVYVWGSMLNIPGIGNMGMVMPADDTDNEFLPEDMVDIEELEKSDYQVSGMNCEKWTPDQDKFKVPEGQKFRDESQMMGQMLQGFEGTPEGEGDNMGIVPGMPAMNCDFCDKIPDAKAKEQCEKTCE